MPGIPAEPAVPVSIAPLERIPHVLGLLETWFLEEWPAWYGQEGPGDARLDLSACLHAPGRLPRCLVALDRASTPVGTVSLRGASPGSERYPGAWLTALLVRSAKRQSGIGTRLIAAAEQEAGHLGFPDIFASTKSAQNLLKRRNWVGHDLLESPGGNLEIFRKPLVWRN